MAAQHKFAIAACARWETRYIVEWLTYYRAIGFDHVYLYCNDDEPGALYERVLPFLQGPAPFVTFYYHAAQGEQTQMYMHFLAHHLNEAEWVSFFDIDEFLRLPPGETIGDFIGRFSPEIDSVLFNWVFFGPGEHEEAPVGNVLENFTSRAISVHPWTKQVTRARCLQAVTGWINGRPTPFWHWPIDLVAAPIAVVNVLGEDCTTYAEGFPDRAAAWVNEPARRQALLNTAVIHHYALRGRGAYRARAARGLGGNFDGQTVWSDIAEGDRLQAHIDQLSAVRDERLADFWPALRARAVSHETQRRAMIAEITPAAAAAPALRLGIALTSFNRRDLVVELVRRLRALTQARYDLVVCDDGSTDGTVDALRVLGVTVVSGPNRGIAWNKNRGLYYLLNHTECDIVLLLDDDVRPLLPGWEDDWIEAARRHGHVNFSFYPDRIVAGANTPADPGLARTIPGVALAFTRQALAEIGYFDLRFARYGHEHSDMSFRAIRAGYGGIALQNGGNTETLFFVIDGGLELAPSTSSGTAAEIKANEAVLAQSGHEPIYRHAWRDDAQMQAFLAEIAGARGDGARCHIHTNSFDSLGAYYAQRDAGADEPGRMIFDIGMSEGNDTAFYLAKGFQVVGVEPDVRMYYHLRERFAAEIEAGRLIVHNLAAAARHGDIVAFHANEVHQGLSGLNHGHAASAGPVRSYHVATIDWPALIARHGLPHYVKIDIEGAETDFLSSWPAGTALPAFVSVECHSLTPVQALHALGYRRFQLIDQNPPGGFALPVIQREGRPVVWPSFSHASGPFGRDLPGPWVDFLTFARQFEAAQARRHETWFDGHAAL